MEQPSPLSTRLPQKYADLEPFIEWALPTMEERIEKRLSVSLEEAKRFYDVMVECLEEALEYLNQYKLGELPEDAQNLLYMAFSLVEISTSVEYYDQMSVPNAIEHHRFPIVPPSSAW